SLAADVRPGQARRGHHGRVLPGRAGPLGDHRAADRGGQARDVDAVLDGEPRTVARRLDPHDPGRRIRLGHAVIVAKSKKSWIFRLEVTAAAASRSSVLA